VGVEVGFDTCPGVTCDAAPTTLTAPPTGIRMRSVKNNDSIPLLIEIHHHVDGIRCIETHQLLIFKTRNNARLDKINPIYKR
jgi:hypothetical protein